MALWLFKISMVDAIKSTRREAEKRSAILMQTNHTKAKLAEGNVVFGAIVNRYAPDQVELSAPSATIS